jgi:hypothetical protein
MAIAPIMNLEGQNLKDEIERDIEIGRRVHPLANPQRLVAFAAKLQLVLPVPDEGNLHGRHPGEFAIHDDAGPGGLAGHLERRAQAAGGSPGDRERHGPGGGDAKKDRERRGGGELHVRESKAIIRWTGAATGKGEKARPRVSVKTS